MLGAGDAGGAGGDDGGGEFVGAVHEEFGGDEFVDEAEFLGFGGVDEAAGEEEIAGALFADLACEENGNDGGKKTDFDFGVAEFGFGNGESEIAKRGDATASCQGVAIDSGDERPGIAPEAAKEFGDAAGVFLIFGGGLAGDGTEHVEIHAGAEGRAGASEDDHANVSLFEIVEGGLDFGDHGGGDGVALFGAVEGDGGERAVGLEEEILVGHGWGSSGRV